MRGPSGTRLEGIAPSNIYPTADGSWVVIAANQDTVFRRLCGAMGQPELATDDRFVNHVARGRNQDELDKIIGAWAAERQPADIIATCRRPASSADPSTPSRRWSRIRSCASRGMLADHFDERIGRNVKGPGVVPVLSETPGTIRNAGSASPGQHNDEVYGDLLGRSAEELDALRRRRACCERRVDVAGPRHHPRGVPARRPADRGPDPVVRQAGTAGGRRRHRGARDRGHRVRVTVEGARTGRRRRAGRGTAPLPAVARRRVLGAGGRPGRRGPGGGRRNGLDRVRGVGGGRSQPGQRRPVDGRLHATSSPTSPASPTSTTPPSR